MTQNSCVLLVATSAFPPLRYLCHLWPVRANERVPLRNADAQFLSDKVLILLHDRDYWNYFAVSEETAHELWPTANIVGGLHYGVSYNFWQLVNQESIYLSADYSRRTLP